jgi:hypothetical protein
MLKEAGFTMDEVMVEAFAALIDPFERIDHLLASAEARRNNVLREIDRHREALGAAMRRGVEEVQDAQFNSKTSHQWVEERSLNKRPAGAPIG